MTKYQFARAKNIEREQNELDILIYEVQNWELKLGVCKVNLGELAVRYTNEVLKILVSRQKELETELETL